MYKNNKKISSYTYNEVNNLISNCLNNSLKSNKIEYSNINSVKINYIVNTINKDMDKCINNKVYKNKYLIINIPIDLINDKVFSSNKNIPLKEIFYYDSNIKINSLIKPYGINNTFIEVKLDINILASIGNKNINYKREYPLVLKLIMGKTPNYYNYD